MKRGLLLLIVLGLAIFLIGCTPMPKVMEEPVIAELPEGKPTSAEHQITITAEGFSPKTITIKAGDIVTFLNEDSNKHWPASAMHPTHTLYPGSSIQKCGSGEKIFDACKGLEQGESFTFTFNEKGSWKYHDHLSVSSTGTVVVE